MFAMLMYASIFIAGSQEPIKILDLYLYCDPPLMMLTSLVRSLSLLHTSRYPNSLWSNRFVRIHKISFVKPLEKSKFTNSGRMSSSRILSAYSWLSAEIKWPKSRIIGGIIFHPIVLKFELSSTRGSQSLGLEGYFLTIDLSNLSKLQHQLVIR